MNRKPEWLTQEQMAESCNISVTGFRRWHVPPVARIGREVFYLAGDVTANRLAHNKKRLEKKAASATGQALIQRAEQLRLTRAQVEFQELKNAELRERLIEVHLLHWVIEQTGKGIAQQLGKIPAALRKKCPRLTAMNHKIIRREIEKCQTLALQMSINLDLETFETN